MNTKVKATVNRTYPFGGTAVCSNGSHTPIDTSLQGWTWRNPLNLLPLSIFILLVIGILGMLS